jgi:hypothetical protein
VTKVKVASAGFLVSDASFQLRASGGGQPVI